MEQAMDLTRQIGIYADGGFRSPDGCHEKRKREQRKRNESPGQKRSGFFT